MAGFPARNKKSRPLFAFYPDSGRRGQGYFPAMFLRKRGESRILTNGHLHSIVKLQALNLHHVLEISIIASQNEGDTGLYTDISGADSAQMVL